MFATVNNLWIALECALAANAEIADKYNLCLIDVLDALLNFAVSVDYAASAVWELVCPSARVCVDLRWDSVRSWHWQATHLDSVRSISALSGLSAVFISHTPRDGYGHERGKQMYKR